MWAVCKKCGRWNLTPLEERWEAIEECERQYRGTVRRSSTDQIGLGRVRDGTDLIRIGQPLRPEFAAWRYGRHFLRRRRYKQVGMAVGLATTAGIWLLGGPLVSFGIAGSALVTRLLTRHNELGRARRFIRRRAEEGFGQRIWQQERVAIRIIPADDEQGWGLRFALDGKFLDFLGHDALHTAHLIAPAINHEGAAPSSVNVAVREIEIAGSPERYFRKVLKFGQDNNWHFTGLDGYPGHMRLAFEMAAHEETERSALEGELQQLETDWREAEEIAAIADNLFLPKSVSDFMERHRPANRG